MPKPPVSSVSDDRITDGFGNDETEVRSAETNELTLVRAREVHDNRCGSRATATPNNAAELSRVQLILLWKHA